MRPHRPKQIKDNSDSQSSASQPDHDDDPSDISQQLCTDNSPKIIPIAKLPEQLKGKDIIINISDTQYPIIEEIAEQFGWVVQSEEGSGDWDIWWTDRQVNPDVLFRMHLHQRINHYPGIYVLARKNLLGMNLMAMKQKFPQEYNFFPETWVLPLEFPKFMKYFEACPKDKQRTYIVKPEALSQGRGIFLTRSLDDLLNGQKYVVQRYLKDPYLIDGLKFDLRIYVLLAGTDPLRLYIYQQGLTRFATKPYQNPTDQNLNDAFIHLTNYSLNKNNPDYIYNQSEQEMDVGHKRTLTSTYQYLQRRGHDVSKLKQKINKILVKTIIAGLPPISHQYRFCQPEEYEGNMCFHILGVDVMISSTLEPFLIEINHTPSFETSTPLDYKIKKSLISDTLKLLRFTHKNKRIWFDRAKQIVKKRVETGKRQIIKGVVRKKLIRQAQKIRDAEEQGHLGAYTKIYPFAKEQGESLKDSTKSTSELPLNDLYQKMIAHSEKVHKDTHEVRKKLIREGQDRMKIKRKEEQQQKMIDSNVISETRQSPTRNLCRTRSRISNSRLKPTSQMKDSKIKVNNGHAVDSNLTKPQDIAAKYLPTMEEDPGKSHSMDFVPNKADDLMEFHSLARKTLQRYNPPIISKNGPGFRTKIKKLTTPIIPNYHHNEEINRFNDFMFRYLKNCNIREHEQGLMETVTHHDNHKSIQPQRNDMVNSRKREQQQQPARNLNSRNKKNNQRDKEGAFLVPRAYEIVEEKRSSALYIHQKLQGNWERSGDKLKGHTQVHKLKMFDNYNSLYKQKRSSFV